MKFCFLSRIRQKQKTNRGSRKSKEGPPREKESKSSSISSKSDSGYSESNLQSSIATVSGVDCVLEDSNKPHKKPSIPLISYQDENMKHVERSQSETDVTRMSADSSSSSGPSEKEQTEIYKPNRNDRKKEKEREKEAIRKQMAQRIKSASERPMSKEIPSEKKTPQSVDKDKGQKHLAEKKPLRQVKSAGSSRTPVNEVLF
jgi:hypothetical protein